MSFPPSSAPTPEDPPPAAETVTALAVGGPEPALDSWSGASRPSQAWRRIRRVAWELVQTLILAAIIFFAVRSMAQNFRVEGSSMEPGLHDGEYLLVNKAVYFKINLKTLSNYIPFVHPGDSPQRFMFRAPRRGDVIVFRFPQDPSRDFIKRVIALPRDTVEIVGGTVFVNGVRLNEPYITNAARYDLARESVPNGSYFVLGDNRNNSFDSHIWGFLPEENIIGQAMVSYWPLKKFGGVGNRSIDVGFISVLLP